MSASSESKPRVVVIGATGSTGTSIVNGLLRSGNFVHNSKGPFYGRARYHSPSSLLIYSMVSGDLRANYLSATRKVSHISEILAMAPPVGSSSSADILACCSHSYHS